MPFPLETLYLPDLPEGYFYRVRREAFGFVLIEIRKRFRWFGSYQVEVCTVLPQEFSAPAFAVRHGCKVLRARLLLRLRVNRLVGDYEGTSDE